MKRPLAALLAALALSSCGGTDEKNKDPQPENGKATPANPVDADLESECRAAAAKWKTFQGKYKAEGTPTVVVTVAVDRDRRAALQVESGKGIVLDGGTMTLRDRGSDGNWYVAEVPIGYLYAAAVAIRDGKLIPARGENPAVPAGHSGVDVSLGLDPDKKAERHLQLAVSLKEVSPFGWLLLLHPQEGITVRALDRTAVLSIPNGRVVIDRDTGTLVEWVLEPPAGRIASLRRESFATDEPLDSALFKLSGQPAPARGVRDVILQYVLTLAVEVIGRERDWDRRLEFTLGFAAAYFRAAWTDAEIDRLAELGAKRRHEIAKEYRASHPDWAEADISAAVYKAGLPTIGDSIKEEISLNLHVLGQLAHPDENDDAQLQQLEQGFALVVNQELALRALEAGKDK